MLAIYFQQPRPPDTYKKRSTPVEVTSTEVPESVKSLVYQFVTWLSLGVTKVGLGSG